jgi:hypothetical protein
MKTAGGVIALSVFLSACGGDTKQQQTAKCELEEIKAYPSDVMATSPEGRHFMHTCMTAAGYDFLWEDKSCVSADVNSANSYCYESSYIHGWREWWHRMWNY